ncbi:MAG: hypothetical protein A3F84_02190 [Candidatus Handelsmanbacteria bacterium RIFCSPLOWO2_12_FULL_64_10]|uniref:Methylamine utilization protein MauG n=1 Tax=Handelsmanbacteria sp. (strain RIFCSPLOWO2_12_FULL_64_10) TaxID=1817868 RepID=A0A1F6D7I8_HANXR|nr:MAG: hypothetical protein A3F84_02190 [Candidatus Handelsmanbacteria bacterium RIFCSPLOWO2_12_FULL_64_10]
MVRGIFLIFLPLQALAQPYAVKVPLGLDDYDYQEKLPKDNPMSAEKVALGRLLFFDRRLSADGTVACATCHDPAFGFTDGQPVPTGVKGRKGRRSAPTILNRAFGLTQFWDGRAASLEEQSRAPLTNPAEMDATPEGVVETLFQIRGYREPFRAAFGTEEVTLDRISKAIAAFERTALSGDSAYDRFEYGGLRDAMPEPAQRGLKLFKEKARCNLCHSGTNYSGEDFHNVGIGWAGIDTTAYGRTKDVKDIHGIDPGRYGQTKDVKDFGAFKAPTLRDVARTAPYAHDGSLKTLEEVIDHYDRGGVPNPFLDPKIQPLHLTAQEKQDLVAFLKALDGQGWQRIRAPEKLPE